MATSLVQSLAPYAPTDVPLIERRQLNFPGINWQGDATTWNFSGAGQSLGEIGQASTPYANYIESVTFGCNRTVLARIIWGMQDGIDGSGNPPLTYGSFVIPRGAPVTIPAGVLLRGGMDKSTGNVYVNAYLDEVYGGDEPNLPWFSDGPVVVTAFATGYSFADDLNFAAEKPILFIGDSLWNGTGATAKTDHIPWRIRSYYADKGQSVRMVLGTQSGTTTEGHDAFIKNGRYDLPRVGAIFYEVGTNDAANAMSATDAATRVAYAIAWKQARYPDAPMVIFGPPPAENNTVETLLATIRTNYAAAVTAAADPLVRFMSLAGSFDRTAGTTSYVSSDPGGSRLHPNAASMALEWNGGYSGFGGIKAWLDANLPTI